MTILQLAQLAVKTLKDKMAQDIGILDVRKKSDLADYFIIGTGSNPTQVKTLSDHVDEIFSKNGREAKIERDTSANWILLDYGDVIVHVFSRTAREHYDLERIWGDAEKYTAEEFLKLGEKDV